MTRKDERNAEVRRLRAEGLSLRKLARRFRVTPERVAQILRTPPPPQFQFTAENHLPGAYLRVLAVVLRSADAGERIDLRLIAADLGWWSIGHVWTCLQALREWGLVTWETTPAGRGRACTIRPTCRMVVFRED